MRDKRSVAINALIRMREEARRSCDLNGSFAPEEMDDDYNIIMDHINFLTRQVNANYLEADTKASDSK